MACALKMLELVNLIGFGALRDSLFSQAMDVPHYSCLLWISINLSVIFDALHKKTFIYRTLFQADICTMAVVSDGKISHTRYALACAEEDRSLREGRDLGIKLSLRGLTVNH